MTRQLTEEKVCSYKRDGLAFPVRVLSVAEAREFREACDLLESDLGGKPRTIEVRQMHLHFAWAFELATRPAILNAVEDVIGQDILIWATELFTKHPGDTTVSIHWHRDQPYLGLIGGQSTTAWIALSCSDAANGCMLALPRSAEAGLTPSHSEAARLQEPPPGSESHVVEVILEPGEMSLHAGDVLHGSGPSQSSEKRVGFVVRYITPDARPVHGKPPVLLARGIDRFQNFATAEAPIGIESASALTAMRGSAMRHLDVVLQNLKRAET